MNAYTVSNFGMVAEPSFYMLLVVFIIAPLIVGSVIDIAATQVAGSQYCSFKDGETRCTILKSDVPSAVRESGRFVVQLSLIIAVVVGFSKVLPVYSGLLTKTPLGVLGTALFIATQSDLMEDFRRLLNGLLFAIKNK